MALIDPAKSYFTFLHGIKGSGKSEYAWYMFDAYPFDRIVLDVTHDLTKLFRQRDVPHKQITQPIPASFPEWMRNQDVENGRLTLVFRPDMGDTDAAMLDLDRCIGLGLRGGPPTLVWADELAACCTEHETGPSLNRALYHGRHDNISLLMCGPRAKKINPLCIGQADKVVSFRTLNHYDRQTVAVNTGLDQREYDAANRALGEFEHTVWKRRGETFETYEKLPKWRRGRRPPVEVLEA